MPGGFPIELEACQGTDQGTDTANSIGTALTGGTSNTKGSYTQLIASSAVDACWIMVCLKETGNATNRCAVDIAIGAAGSEKVIISNVLVEGSTNGFNGTNCLFPCQIKAGSRISARAQNQSATADGPNVSVILFDGAMSHAEGTAGVDDIGFVSGSTAGTLITASASANAKGSYAQLNASTSRDYLGFIIRISVATSGTPADRALLDIAIGASGSEIVIVPNIPISCAAGGSSGIQSIFMGPFFVPIPAGTRIAARIQADAASNTTGLMLHAIYK